MVSILDLEIRRI